jgi:hypothetical protein
MAQKPDGKAAKTDRVVFTRPAAERISKVVREVEAGDRDQAGLTFGNRVGGSGKAFRVCTFTGAWSIGSTKNVTFKYQSTTPNTAVATNLFFPVAGSATLNCAIAKDGTAWFLVDVPFYTASAVFLTAFSVGATLNTETCAITVATTSSTVTATFLRIGVP